MGTILNVVGRVQVPAGLSAVPAGGVVTTNGSGSTSYVGESYVGDLTLRFSSTMRGGPVVAGGILSGYVTALGDLVDASGQPLRLPVLFPSDMTDAHPFALIDISWRGAAVGYQIVLDLLVASETTALDITKPLAPRQIVLAGRATELEVLLKQAEALMPQVQQAGAFAATAADAAFGSIGGKLVMSQAELDDYRPPDGAWATIGLQRFFRRESGAWVEHELSALKGSSLPAGGTAGQALLRTATGYEWGNVTTGDDDVAAYTPSKQRMLTTTNPFSFRTELVIRAVVSTNAAQADGRDIQVFASDGSKLPTSVRHVVPTTAGADYHIAFTDTLDGGQQRSYTVKYGDPFAPERLILNDALSKALSRPTRRAGPLVVQYDPSAGFRPADFLTGTPSWVNAVDPEWGPEGVNVALAGAVGRFFVDNNRASSFLTDQTAGRIEVDPREGQVRPAFLMSYTSASVLTVQQALAQTANGLCMVGRALSDGYVIDIRSLMSWGKNSYDISIRYRAGAGWVWTLHHIEGNAEMGSLNATAGVRADANNAVKFFGVGGLAPEVSNSINPPKRDNPESWVAFTVDYIREASATVGAEAGI